MQLIVKLLVQAVAIFVSAYMLPGVTVNDLYSALIVAVVLSLVNIFIKPFIMLFTLPITVLTFGLFSIVVNALLILFVDYIVQGFAVANFWWAIIFSLVLSVVNWILIKIVE